MAIVGVIGDTHWPSCHDRYAEFCAYQFQYWGVDRVVHIGDGADFQAISFHAKKPNIDNITTELHLAIEQSKVFVNLFPEVDYLIGNHSALPQRQAEIVGLSADFIRPLEEVLELPWAIHPRYHDLVIDGVIYRHGDKGKGGQYNPAFLNSKSEFMSVVQGHYHSIGAVNTLANTHTRVFGLQVGCGTDPRSTYMEYARKYAQRPVLGCGIVVHGKEGHFIPMHLDEWPRHNPSRKDLV